MRCALTMSCLLAMLALAIAIPFGCDGPGSGGGDGPQDDNGLPDDNGPSGDWPPVPGGEYFSADRPRVNGVEYYVAPNGDDGNAGTIDSPWATIQYAAEMLEPGNVVYLRDGVYHESVVTVASGTSDGDIVFAAYSDERPIIDGTDVDANNGFIVVHDYIVLQGLTIRNWPENAIWMEGAGFPYVVDCEVYEVSSGVGVAFATHDFVFDHVSAHDFDLYGFDATPVDSDCYNGVYWHCLAHTGRDPDQNVDGFALGHGAQHNFWFYQCEAYDVYDGFDVGENAGSGTDIVFDRCVAHDCWNDGYKLTGGGELVNCLSYGSENSNVSVVWGENAGTVTLRNCTLVDAGTYNIWVENANDSLHMYNTILAGGRNIGLAFEQRDATRYQGDYNLFQNETERAIVIGYEDEFSTQQLDAWRTASGQDANSVTASSLEEPFIDPAASDFHLAVGSPAADHGTSAGAPTDDYDGTDRPQGPGIDIGAFEQ